MSVTPYADDLALALLLADRADELTQAGFGTAVKVRTKADTTPVSEVDTAVEKILRSLLTKHRPSDAIVGEEYGGKTSSKRIWIIDPIDGTKNYIHSNPFYATIIALREGEQTVAAVVSAPMLGQRWWATYKGGAWRNGQQLHVSSVKDLQSAYLTFSSLKNWRSTGMIESFMKLYDSCGRQRAFGDFYNLMLVAEGAVDIAIEPTGLNVWDIAGLCLIIEEAGGICGNLLVDGEFDGSLLATNGSALYEQAKAIFF